jgi:hypothetical protein
LGSERNGGGWQRVHGGLGDYFPALIFFCALDLREEVPMRKPDCREYLLSAI